MKKKLLVIVLAVAVVLTFAFVGCAKNDKTIPSNSKVFSNKNDLLAISAVSVGNMMGTFGGGTSMMATEVNPEANVQVDPNLVKINYYMSVVEGILGSNVKSETVDIAADDPDFGGKFAKKNTITTGEDETLRTYVMVYNETLLTPDKEDADEDEKDEETETEQEEEFKLEGLMFVDNVTYLIEGKRESEVEEEDGETEAESEFEFTAYVALNNEDGSLKKDLNNYINFKQEIETEGSEAEQEFTYQIYKNGVAQDPFSIEIEKDPKDNELEVSLVDGNLTLEFKSERKSDTKEVIKIYANDNGENFQIEAEVTVDANGNKVYKYTSEDGEDLGSLEDDFDEEDDD